MSIRLVTQDKRKYIRLLRILSVGSFFVFLTSFVSQGIKTHLTQNYAQRITLIPQATSKHSRPLSDVDIQFVNQQFPDIKLSYVNQQPLINVHTKHKQSLTLSYETTFSPYLTLSSHIALQENFQLGDHIIISATGIPIMKIEPLDVDILIPAHLIDYFSNDVSDHPELLVLNNTPFAHDAISLINKISATYGTSFKAEYFNGNELIYHFMSLFEKIILGFSLIIFINSTTNLGTIMPFIVHQQKGLISILYFHGMARKSIESFFHFLTSSLMLISLVGTYLSAFLISMIVFILCDIPLTFSYSTLFLFAVQFLLGYFITLLATKKATRREDMLRP